MSTIDEENHKTFLEAVKKSDRAVFAVAAHLRAAGYPVRLNIFPQKDRENRMEPYNDNGDLEISHRIEVKQLRTPFTCLDDWPFPIMLIVDKKHFDRTRPVPYAFWTLNPEMTHAAVVRTSSRDRWFEHTHGDIRYKNYSQVSYACDMGCVQFVELKGL